MACQGRTGQLDEEPKGLERGPHMCLSRSDAFLFMAPVDRTTVLCSLSLKMPESKAAELHALFRDPTAVQVDCNQPSEAFLQPSKILYVSIVEHHQCIAGRKPTRHVSKDTILGPSSAYSATSVALYHKRSRDCSSQPESAERVILDYACLSAQMSSRILMRRCNVRKLHQQLFFDHSQVHLIYPGYC